MKRIVLIRKLDEFGCVLSAMELGTRISSASE